MNAAAEIIYEVVDPEANIIFGAVIDERMQGELRITVIATGFTHEIRQQTLSKPTTARRSVTPPSVGSPPPPSIPKISQPDWTFLSFCSDGDPLGRQRFYD